MSAQIEICDILRCPYCEKTILSASDTAIHCATCRIDFPRRFGIVNTLVDPTEGVRQEIRGGMAEAGMTGESIDEYIFRRTDRIETLAERKERTNNDGYYLMTELNFQKGLEYLDIRGDETVLEVGGNFDFPFMQEFEKRGCTCFETNIFFYHDGRDGDSGINRVAADMTALPYRDRSFDVVIFSATLHHAPDLDRAVAEISRVLKDGGTALVLSEPTAGTFKKLWGLVEKKYGIVDRDHDIHEGEYSVGLYKKTFRKNDFRIVDSFFAPYYDVRLRTGVSGVRFAPIATIVAALWRAPGLRPILLRFAFPLGQALIGLQLNLVVRKPPATT